MLRSRLYRSSAAILFSVVAMSWGVARLPDEHPAPAPEKTMSPRERIARLRATVTPLWGWGLTPDEIALARSRYVACEIVGELGTLVHDEPSPYSARLIGLLGVLKSPESIDALTRLARRDKSLIGPVLARWNENVGYYVHHQCEWDAVRSPWARFFGELSDPPPELH